MLQLLNAENSHWQGSRCHKDVTHLEFSSPGRDLWLHVDIKLNKSLQSIFAGLKAHSTRQSITRRWKELILPLDPAMGRPHLGCCDLCWAPQCKRDSSKGQLRWLRNGSIFPIRKADKARTGQPGEGSGNLTNQRGSCTGDGARLAQWCWATQAEQSDIQEVFPLSMRKPFLWGGWVTGTGCPRRLWRLYPWRDSKAIWTQSWSSGPTWSWGLEKVTSEVPANTHPLWWKCWRFITSAHCRGSQLFLQVAATAVRGWQMSPPPPCTYMAHRTLFLQTRDWQWGQMGWGMAAQSRISIKPVSGASIANNGVSNSHQPSTVLPTHPSLLPAEVPHGLVYPAS